MCRASLAASNVGRALPLGRESIGSVLSGQADRAAALDLLVDRFPLYPDVRARQRSKYCPIQPHGLERERWCSERNQRACPNRRCLLVDWVGTGPVPL